MRKILTDKRYRHSLGVEEVAYDLALIHGCDCTKSRIAGILHDCAKHLTNEELIEECMRNSLPISDVENQSIYLLHAKVGATFAQLKYGIEDVDIINAITYHTTGRPNMTLLEKIIFTADYIEPFRRPLPRIDYIREIAYNDLDFAVLLILENTLDYLQDIGVVIDPLTIETYHYYKKVLVLK